MTVPNPRSGEREKWMRKALACKAEGRAALEANRAMRGLPPGGDPHVETTAETVALIREAEALLTIEAQGPAPDVQKFAAYLQTKWGALAVRLTTACEEQQNYRTLSKLTRLLARAQTGHAEAVELQPAGVKEATTAEERTFALFVEACRMGADLANERQARRVEAPVMIDVAPLPALPD